MGEAIAKIQQEWANVYPQLPFDYGLVDQEFEKQYVAENKFGSLFLVFTVLGLFIGALGHFWSCTADDRIS